MIFKVQFSRWFFYIPLDDGRFFFTRSKKKTSALHCFAWTIICVFPWWWWLFIGVFFLFWLFWCFPKSRFLRFQKKTLIQKKKNKKKLSGLLLLRKVCIALRKLDVALSLVMAVAMMVLLVVAISQPIWTSRVFFRVH